MDLSTAIIESTSDVFSTMVMLNALPGSPLPEKVLSFENSITGMLGFSGDFKGILRIHCTNHVAMAITGSMLGMEVCEIDEDVRDAICEIANMVAGGVKNFLANENIAIELSIPTAIGGKNYSLHRLAKAGHASIPFVLEAGQMLVELEYISSR
jgi:chemotaxis protein CheX